jgi:hypothetical protein
VLATLLEVVGFLAVVAAAWLVSLPLALLVFGIGLIVGAQAFGRPRAKR